jgi:hypothetical protein
LGRKVITKEELDKILNYNPDTGAFLWNAATGPRAKKGTLAGNISKVDGYVRIHINYKHYLAHRLAILTTYGKLPTYEVDHINGNRADNSLNNLRLSTRKQNMENLSLPKSNTSGKLGASFHKATGKWRARIRIEGSCRHLGLFDSAEAAHAAYCEAKSKFHTFNPTVRGK